MKFHLQQDHNDMTLKPMTQKEIKKWCDEIRAHYKIPKDMKGDIEAVKKMLSEKGISLCDELQRMRDERRDGDF